MVGSGLVGVTTPNPSYHTVGPKEAGVVVEGTFGRRGGTPRCCQLNCSAGSFTATGWWELLLSRPLQSWEQPA